MKIAQFVKNIVAKLPLTTWRADYKKILEQRDAWKAAFDEVEGQRNSFVTEVGKLRSTLEKAEVGFHALHGTWLMATHRCDMNKEMDHLSRIFARKCDCPECNEPDTEVFEG